MPSHKSYLGLPIQPIDRFRNHISLVPPKTASQMISHIMFADDLIVFSKGTPLAAANRHALLNHFSWFSGLGVNWAKSSVFFFNCPEEDKCAIFSILNVVERKLPVRYLGVPLS